VLAADQINEIADRLHPLLKNAKFWKFGKHAVSMVCHVDVVVSCYFACFNKL